MDKQKSDTSHFAAAVILVVDDDSVQRDILQIILSDEGYQTHVASSAEEALKVAKTLKPDVVLTDLRMHKMNGIELMEKLRSQEDCPGGDYNVRLWHPPHNRGIDRKGGVQFYDKTT